MFDPRKLGCRCDECPLGIWARKRGVWLPVPPEGPEVPRAVLLAEEPGPQEERYQRPQIGPSGQFLERALGRLGYLREEVWLDNALLCFPGSTRVVSPSPVRWAYRRWYEGTVIRITTVAGHQLTGTPNHPVFTPGGLTPLDGLAEGDRVLCRSGQQGEAVGDPDVEAGPTRIEELFRTLAESGVRHRVAGADVDFHGDGSQGEIEVVGPHGKLWNGAGALVDQQLSHVLLEGSDHRPSDLVGPCSGFHGLRDDLGRPQSPVGAGLGSGRFRDLPPLVLRSLRHAQGVGFAAGAEGHTALLEGPAYNALVNPHTPCDGFCGSSSGVRGDGGLCVDLAASGDGPETHRICLRAQRDALLAEQRREAATRHMDFRREGRNGLSVEVAADQVRKVERLWWSGHVYNLETGDGRYFAEGILVSNCRPPMNDLDRFNAEQTGPMNMEVKLANKGKPRDQRLPKIPTPQEACRPHVARLVDRAAELGIPVITLGKLAYWSVTGRRPAVEKVRGSFGEYVRSETGALVEPTEQLKRLLGPMPTIKVTATVNPAYALRKAPYKEVLERDLERGFRWVKGELQWEDPTHTLISDHPSAAFLTKWLSEGAWWSWDLETTKTIWGDEIAQGEMVNQMRTIGIYSIDRQEGIVIPWVSIDGKTGFASGVEGAGTLTLSKPLASDLTEAQRIGNGKWWEQFDAFHYGEGEGRAIRAALIRWALDETKIKIGHYSGYFDTQVFERHLGVRMRGNIDQIILCRIWRTELSRSLYMVGTMLTDVPAWKAAEDDRKIAHDPRSYRELAVYQHTDDVVTAKTGIQLIREARSMGKWPVAELDHQVQQICYEMRQLGMWVDEDVRGALESDTRAKLDRERRVVEQIGGKAVAEAGIDEFNPNSVKQLGRLLYDLWELPVFFITKSGARSTSEDAIRKFLTTPGLLSLEQRVFLETLWRSRGIKKDLDVLMTFRRRSGGGLTYEDGVIRPGYGAHIPATGRMSSFDPNCFDGETEILTERGWVRFDELPRDLRVAQFHDEDASVTFVEPTSYVEHEHHGDLIHIQSEQTDLLVTPDHRCLLHRRGRRGQPDRSVVVLAEAYPNGEHKQLHSGRYAGGPGLAGMPDSIWMRLLVMVQADGALRGNRLVLTFRKARKVTRCRDLLDLAKVAYTETQPPSLRGGTSFHVKLRENPTLDAALDHFRPRKVWGAWLLDASREQLDAFVDELWHWDGCFTRKSQYSSSVRENSDWVQAILALTGAQRANLRRYHENPKAAENWIVDVSGKPYSWTSNRQLSRVPWGGQKVYCVSVPSSYIIVRRHGKVAVTGQCQNIKLILRKIIRPRKGNLFLQADYDQIELRMFSALAGIAAYLRAFADGSDPHAVTALLIYGAEFEEALAEYKRLGKGATKYVALRRFAKTFVYCVLYGGTEQTAYEAVSKATDPDTGELLFPNMTFHQVAACVRTWMRNAPQVEVFWNKTWQQCEMDGYVEEPILGRRRHMPAFERNESLNHGIQGGAGIVMSQGLVRMREVFVPDYERGTGIVNQMHDAATIEVPEDLADKLRPVMEERMTAEYPDKVPGVTFSTKAVVTMDFAETKFRYAVEHQKTLDKTLDMILGLRQERELLAKIKEWKKIDAEERLAEMERDLVALPAWDISERNAQFALHYIEGEAGKLAAAMEHIRKGAK